MGYWVYTSESLQEAITKANAAIELINTKGQEIFGGYDYEWFRQDE